MNFVAAKLHGSRRKSKLLLLDCGNGDFVDIVTNKRYRQFGDRQLGKSFGSLGYRDGSTAELRVDCVEVEESK